MSNYSSAVLLQIAALPYYSPQLHNEVVANEVRRLFGSLFPEIEKDLCKSCKTDVDYRYLKLKAILKKNGPKMKDQAKQRYRFADDQTVYALPFSSDFYSNANLTDQIAEELLEQQPGLLKLLLIDDSVVVEAKKTKAKETKAKETKADDSVVVEAEAKEGK